MALIAANARRPKPSFAAVDAARVSRIRNGDVPLRIPRPILTLPAGFGTGCAASVQRSAGINGNFAADAMASVISHESIESINDPTLRSWWDSGNGYTSGFENSDMCKFQFGATNSLGGANYNVVLNGDKYLLQQQWIDDTSAGANHLNYNGGRCGLPVAFGTAAPEPSALSLLSPGIFGLRWLRRRRAGSGVGTDAA